MIKQRGLFVSTYNYNSSRETANFQLSCALVHKSVTSIVEINIIRCIRLKYKLGS